MIKKTEDGLRLVSNSEIQTYKDCKRKWWLSYYRGLVEPSPKIGPLAIGTRIHLALAAYYDPTSEDDPMQVLEEIIDLDREKVNEDDIKKFEDEAELARIVLEGYFVWALEEGVDESLEFIAPEVSIEAKLTDDVLLVGRLDAVVRNKEDGFLRFVDHKTLASLAIPHLHLDEQMMMYQLMQRLSSPDGEVVIGGIYNILKKNKRTARAKPPFYAREEVLHNDQEMRAFYQRVVGVVKDIQATEDALDEGADHHYYAYPSPGRDCSWKCSYFAMCHAFDDGSYAEEWVNSSFSVEDPYERRYNDVVTMHSTGVTHA